MVHMDEHGQLEIDKIASVVGVYLVMMSVIDHGAGLVRQLHQN